nr:VOC family protein [Kineosporia babensis]
MRIGTVVVNTQDMGRATRFWMRALGYRLRDEDIDPEFTTLVHHSGAGPRISLQYTDHASAEPARVHLDLYTTEQERHVERLVGLGATRVAAWNYPEEPDFVVLRDPDGNEFCVIDQAKYDQA